ncbi:unnamed protein product [Arabis nemorensis]|uniref:Uncharacterized protein n=1 Tax=Arabis nemorensis TaxID=586526 RepID=A0A565BUV4_9BRAS|nr:unnamed protein product [Arabis nemorensis]
MSSIFTAAVLASDSRQPGIRRLMCLFMTITETLRLYGDEFLCRENLVESNDLLAHYVLDKMDKNSTTMFCSDRKKRSVSS